VSGSRAAAAFSVVDGTLLPGASTEMLPVRALLGGRLPGRFRWRPFLRQGVRLLPSGWLVARKANKAGELTVRYSSGSDSEGQRFRN